MRLVVERTFPAVLLLPSLTGCAASPDSVRPASAPTSVTPAPLTIVAPGAARTENPLGQAQGDFEAASRELSSTMSTCETACHALDSMDRATGRLCAHGAAGDDAEGCVEAKGKVIAARARVRAACHVCPGGPTLDGDAPIPSR